MLSLATVSQISKYWFFIAMLVLSLVGAACSPDAPPAASQMPVTKLTEWEYQSFEPLWVEPQPGLEQKFYVINGLEIRSRQSLLDTMSNYGWELTTSPDNSWVFKRQKGTGQPMTVRLTGRSPYE